MLSALSILGTQAEQIAFLAVAGLSVLALAFARSHKADNINPLWAVIPSVYLGVYLLIVLGVVTPAFNFWGVLPAQIGSAYPPPGWSDFLIQNPVVILGVVFVLGLAIIVSATA